MNKEMFKNYKNVILDFPVEVSCYQAAPIDDGNFWVPSGMRTINSIDEFKTYEIYNITGIVGHFFLTSEKTLISNHAVITEAVGINFFSGDEREARKEVFYNMITTGTHIDVALEVLTL